MSKSKLLLPSLFCLSLLTPIPVAFAEEPLLGCTPKDSQKDQSQRDEGGAPACGEIKADLSGKWDNGSKTTFSDATSALKKSQTANNSNGSLDAQIGIRNGLTLALSVTRQYGNTATYLANPAMPLYDTTAWNGKVGLDIYPSAAGFIPVQDWNKYLKFSASYSPLTHKDKSTQDDPNDGYTTDGKQFAFSLSDKYDVLHPNTQNKVGWGLPLSLTGSLTYKGIGGQFDSTDTQSNKTEAYWQKSINPVFKPEYNFGYIKVSGTAGYTVNLGAVKTTGATAAQSNTSDSFQGIADVGIGVSVQKIKELLSSSPIVPKSISLTYDHLIYSNAKAIYYDAPINNTTTKGNTDDAIMLKLSYDFDALSK